MDIFEKQKYIFGKIFLLSNKLQLLGDRILAEEMTVRQWLLTAAAARPGESFPTLGEAAELMGSSHQNVKQLALKLQRGGFLEIVRDSRDQRTARLVLTEKSRVFWERRQADIRRFLSGLFEDMSENEIDLFYECINKLYERVKEDVSESESKKLKGCIK